MSWDGSTWALFVRGSPLVSCGALSLAKVGPMSPNPMAQLAPSPSSASSSRRGHRNGGVKTDTGGLRSTRFRAVLTGDGGTETLLVKGLCSQGEFEAG
jgi:hypothetical protein